MERNTFILISPYRDVEVRSLRIYNRCLPAPEVVGRRIKGAAKMTKFANSAGQNRPWFEERYRRILLDNHIPDWDSRFLKNYDAKTIARRIADSHVNVALISYKGLWGDSYYE